MRLDQSGLAVADPWHGIPVETVAQKLETNATRGLSAETASQRLQQFGPNLLATTHARSALSIFLAQFYSLIVFLLFAATLVAFTLGDIVEAAAILVVILLNSTIGFVTEWKAEQALAALQKMSVPTAHVIRDGKEHQIPAAELVPGDLVVLTAGARVPADGRIVESQRLQIDEAILTGESHAVDKTCEAIPEPDAALGDRLNMAFMATTITDGRGRMLVTDSGMRSEVGKIGALIHAAPSRDTPLERKLTQLGRLLVAVVVVLCAIIILAGWLRGLDDFWHLLEVGISLAIAAVPEGLPAVATMTLALGMLRMARRGALVRRLPAVEALGSTTVICTDKTGTLTKNEMTVQVLVLDSRRIEITGTGYTPMGNFIENGTPLSLDLQDELVVALRIGVLCNDAKVVRHDGQETVLGDPTEAALVVAAEKAHLHRDTLELEYPRIGEIPFDSASKRMVTIHQTPEQRLVAMIKGSPGALLAASHQQVRAGKPSPLNAEDRQRWEAMNAELASSSLRVLGLAYHDLPDDYTDQDLAEGFTFVGLVGMMDPLRDEAKAAIATCRAAGIRTIMITGDQQATAAEIARQLGIDQDLQGRPLRTVHARELTNLDDAGWQQIVADAAVFARVSPEHKLLIVKALQEQGHVVAMTGDGVNDAPALKKADIGVAMGIKGTEVAKENAAMVITDDNFATIVDAVEQGRIIYANILRFIQYLLSCNLSEILTVFFAIILGWPLPLGALQILWLNLLTDVFPALSLALEPSAPNMMQRPPRDPQEPPLTPRFLTLIGWQGLLLTTVAMFAFWVGLRWYGSEGEGLRRATTMVFMTLSLSQVFHVFNARSRIRSAFTAELFQNGWLWAAVVGCLLLQCLAVTLPPLQRLLHTVSPTWLEWGVIIVCALTPVIIVEVVKLAQRLTLHRVDVERT